MKTLHHLLKGILLAALFACCGSAMAVGVDLVGDDTDLFTTNPNIPAQVPNVLFLIDNTSSWNSASNGWGATGALSSECTTAGFPFGTSSQTKQGDAELCAIYVETGKLSSGVNVGFMEFNTQNNGSFVRFPMSSMTSTNITNFQNTLKINVNGSVENVGSNSTYEDKMNDVFRYFNSLGTFRQNATPTVANNGGYTDSNRNNFQFIAGQNGDTCGYDYIVFIGNTFPNTQSWTANPPAGGAADLVAAASLLNDPNVTFGTNNADLIPLQNTGSNVDVWSKFLFKYGVKVANGSYRHVTTYTINVCSYSATGVDTCPTDQPGGASQTTLLKSMASVSNGKYFSASNLAQIQTALSTIFAEVQAVNSVFAATTLPVSINVRGTNLNQVYIGVFRPDALASPRWLGNLKQYQLGVNSVTGALQLVDANGTQAVNLNTGFISNSATSFWTTAYDADPNTTGIQGFWSYRAPFATTDVGRDQDAPDGDLVEKGGVAERIRITYPSPDSTGQVRNIYTCTGACTTGSLLSDTPFAITNTDITGTLLGTYQAFTVTSLTASGTTATATTSLPHGFITGNQVTIAGAVPNLFNGVYSVTVPTGSLNTFTYTLTSAPDTTHAYVTQAGYALVPGTDLVTVTGASPTDYNVTTAAISAVSGNANQYSYALATSPCSAASGYSVTGVRRVQVSGGTSMITWSNGSALNNVTVNLSAHGYSSGDTVAISGATDSAFNTSGSVIVVNSSNQFTYTTASTPAGGATTTGIATPSSGSIPSGWQSGTVIKVSGASGNFNTPASGSPITVTGNTFSYGTNGTVSGSATGTLIANRYVASDQSTWTINPVASFVSTTATTNFDSTWSVTGITTSGSGNSQNVAITLTAAKFTDVVTGQVNALRNLVASDISSLSFGGTCTYTIKVGSTNTVHPCSDLLGTPGGSATRAINTISGATNTVVGTPSTTYSNLSPGVVTLTFAVVANISATSIGTGASAPTLIYTGASSATTNSAIRFTLSRGIYTGQFLRKITVGDTLSVSNCTYLSGSRQNCDTGSGMVVTAVSGDSSVTSAVTAAGSYGDISGTVTIDVTPSNVATASSLATVATSAGAAPTASATTLAWTGATTGPNIALSSITAGPLTVNAAGTIYASKSGDLTSKVTSITNQSQATGTITAGLATVPDPAERSNLINWVRGADNKDDENKNGVSSDIRASVHGDVLHSRPAVINYNRTTGNNDVYVFYGANDGMFHAVKGGQSTDGGNEQWDFIALEHFGKLKRLRDQTPVISSNYPKGYFFDGPIGVYTLDANSDGKLTSGASGDKVYLYTAMRRGGRMIYAFDVTDPTAPRLLWKKGCTQPTGTGAAGGCDSGWEVLGQTWSQPQVVYLRAYPTTPVLIFGGGYDSPAEDFQPCYVTSYSSTSVTGKTGLTPPTPMSAANCPPSGGTSATQSRTMGQGVFIVNALTGAVLWRAGSDGLANMIVSGMNYSITADLAILRNRTNTAARTGTTGVENVPTGYMDRIYAPDTGGNVWRLDVADANPANWVVTKLASIATSNATSSTTGSPAAADMRKFEFQPDVVYASNPTTGQLYDAVLLGSGDREHPFDMVVNNRFYMIRDVNTGTLTPSTPTPTVINETGTAPNGLTDITDGCLQNAANCAAGETQATVQADLDSRSGWKFLFAPTNIGEKTISSATTAASTVIFNTNQPKQDTVTGSSQNVGANASNQCTSDLGTARQYGINFQNGNSQNIFNALPTQYVPTAGLGRYATFAGGGFLPTPVPVVVQIGGKYYQTVIAGVQTTNPGGLKLQSRLRTYWYRKTD